MPLKIYYILLASVLMSCGGGHEEGEHHYHSVLDRIAHEGNEKVNVPIDNKTLVNIDYEMVQLASDSTADFYVESRLDHIMYFECTECNTKPLSELREEAPLDGKKAHWDINLKHAHASTMKCNTCHDMDHAPNQLITLQKDTLHFNQSYQLCGQCHSTQYKDWQGGAHGKELGGWSKPRVVKNCASCHNPHKPAFEARWPARLNTKQVLQEQKLEHE